MAHAERLGKYELVRHLASGGMARVYLARVSGVGGFERHVVLKTVRPERIEDQSYVTMFLDEARLVATLHHQNVAQVYEIGVADDGTYFLAMEYLHGETLRAVLEHARMRGFRLGFEFSLTVVCAAAAGLHHAHGRRGPDGTPLGIVHRDVSPSNVIVGFDGAVKLIDFGIAKAEARSTRTMTGFVKGKAGYMAPEQALGYAVDRRSDVFALGVVLYELTTQARCFRAASEYESVQRIVAGDVTPPTQVYPGYPTELEDIVLTALAVDPDDRFQDADAMRRALELTAHHLGVVLGPAAVTRTLGDLFGTRLEPWLADLPTAVVPDATAAATESAPLLAMPVGVAKLRPSAVASLAQISHEPDEIPTSRFINLEGELPPPLPLPSPPTPPRSPILPPAIPPPRIAAGSTPPKNTTATRRTDPTVPLRTGNTPPPRPSAMVVTPLPTILPPRPPTMSAKGTETELRPYTRLRKHTVAIAAGVAFVLGIGIVAIVGSGADGANDAPPAAPPAAAPASPTPAPPAPTRFSATEAPDAGAEPRRVTLRVETDPPGATVVLDGKRLGRSPFVTTIEASDREAVLKVRKRGRVPKRIKVKLDQDIRWEIRLPRRR